MFPFTVERIRAAGHEIVPAPMLFTGTAQSIYVYTLQHWLSLTVPRFYDKPCSGTMDADALKAFGLFAISKNLPVSDKIDVAGWDSLEESLAGLRHADVAQRLRPELKDLKDPATAMSMLRSLGISVDNDDASIRKGWILWQALSRKIDKFEHLSILGDSIQMYPELLNGTPPATLYIVEHFTNYWTVFYGAPWLGVQANVPATLDVADALWCSSRLYKFLRKLGQSYIQTGLDKNFSLETMLENPLIVLYTGKKTGGLIAGRNDFSQIGMSAAIELTPFHMQNLELISEALMKADPSYRLRIAKDDALPKLPNIHSKQEFVITPVLEPEYEKLFYKPASIKKVLLQQPALFDRIPAQRLGEGISENAAFITPDEYALILKTLKAVNFSTELDFISAMRERGGLGFMLKKFAEEERSFLEAMLAINIRSFDILGQGVNDFYDKLVEFESKFAEILNVKESLAETLLQTGVDLVRKKIGDFVRTDLKDSLIQYVKHRI